MFSTGDTTISGADSIGRRGAEDDIANGSSNDCRNISNDLAVTGIAGICLGYEAGHRCYMGR
jgi:hypothetical protein